MSTNDFRGGQIGTVVVAESGNVHFASADMPELPVCPEPYIPHAYALATGNFVGRESELGMLSTWAREGTEPVLAIIGLGGIGKSALAWNWLYREIERAPRAFDGFLWWSFYEEDAGYINFVLHAVAYLSGEKLFRVAERSVDENCRRLIALLNTKRILLCLDGHERITEGYRSLDIGQAAGDMALPGLTATNAIDAAYAGHTPTPMHATHYRQGIGKSGAFLRQICGIRKARVLITSRLLPAEFETPERQVNGGVRLCDEMQLSDPDAIALLQDLKITGPEDSLLRIANDVGNHALTLRVLAGDVRRDRRACGSLEIWLKTRPDFDLTALNIVQRKTHVLHAALLGLNARTLTALASIAAFRGPADYDHLVRILIDRNAVFKDDVDLDAAFDELEQRYLLGWNREQRTYDMHPIVRGIVWRRLDEAGRRQIALFHGTYFSEAATQGGTKPAQQFYLLHQWIFSLIELKRYEDAFDRLAERVVTDVVQEGRSHEVVEILEALLGNASAGALRLTTPGKHAECLKLLSFAYSHACRHFDSVHCAAELARCLDSLDSSLSPSYKNWLPRNATIGLIHLGRIQDARAFWNVTAVFNTQFYAQDRFREREELLGFIDLAEGHVKEGISRLTAFIAGGSAYGAYPTDLGYAALTIAVAMDDDPDAEVGGFNTYNAANFAVSLASKYGLAALRAQAEMVKVDLDARQRGDRLAALPRLRRLVEKARVRRFLIAEIEGLTRILAIAATGSQISIAEQAAEELEHLAQLHDRRGLQAHIWLRLMRFYCSRNDHAAARRAAQAALRATVHHDSTPAMKLLIEEVRRCEPDLEKMPQDNQSDLSDRTRAAVLDDDVRSLIAAFSRDR